MFKGSRDPGVDYFDDVLRKDDAGVFGGLGIEDYDGLKEEISPEGLKIRMNCRSCGKEHDVTLEWQELYIAGTNGLPGASLLLPNGWQYSQNNGKLYPANIKCSKCPDGFLCPQITPDEARARVNDALSQNLIDPNLLAQWKQQVTMYRQQRGG